jgi:transcriptional regulatory protein LevR
MGSLAMFESTITERTGIQVRSIDMVSTPIILEAVRKSSILDMPLEDVYHSLKNFRGYDDNLFNKGNFINKTIITVCSSGRGTAEKLKEIVEKTVISLTGENVNIIPVGVKELDKTIKQLKKENILAVIGIKKPTENIPFISVEKLLDVNGEVMLREILTNNNLTIVNEDKNLVIKDLCENSLVEFLTYLNPHKIIGILLRFIVELEKNLEMELDNSMKISLISHVAYALERMITGEGLMYGDEKDGFSERVINAVNNSCKLFNKNLKINLTDDEKYYICRILVEKYQKVLI